jgi:four helix bundle protein
MARDHRKLRVFHDAHQQVLAIYKTTCNFPRDEWYALRSQIRKAAVSVPSNIVEGNARRTTKEYVHFLDVARGSAAELTYLVDLASELGYLSGATFKALNDRCERVCRQLEALLRTMELLLIEEQRQKLRRKGTSRRNADEASDQT